VAGGLAAALTALAVRRRSSGIPAAPDPGPALQAQGVRIERLADALNRRGQEDAGLRDDLGRARQALESLRARSEEQRRGEQATWEVMRRLETVLVGGGARGRPGENILQEALGSLPPQMVVRDFRVNGCVVEFALVLPDGRRLPVDSKWAALREIEALDGEEDAAVRESLGRAVERAVAKRAAEVSSYLDPSLTTPFAVACVPDAAYDACRKAHAEAFAKGVVLVPYSRALPVLLALFALASRYGSAGDAEGCLAELDGLLGSMEQTLENKLARATTMLQNAADEWRTQVGKARGALARGRGSVAAEDEEPPVWRAVSG
jgi:hypothetical protein